MKYSILKTTEMTALHYMYCTWRNGRDTLITIGPDFIWFETFFIYVVQVLLLSSHLLPTSIIHSFTIVIYWLSSPLFLYGKSSELTDQSSCNTETTRHTLGQWGHNLSGYIPYLLAARLTGYTLRGLPICLTMLKIQTQAFSVVNWVC